jgi:hypothetical protein
MASETLGFVTGSRHIPKLFESFETIDRPLADVTVPHSTPLDRGNVCDDPDIPPYATSGMSRQSVGEVSEGDVKSAS